MKISYLHHCLLVLSALSVGCDSSADEQRPWWDDYPTIYSTVFSQSSTADVLSTNATISFNNALAAPGWGTYGQKVVNRPDLAAEAHAAGLKNMAYFETFGTSRSVIVELDPKGPDDEFVPVRHMHWNWESYSGGPIAWAGAPAWFDDQEFARPFTRTHPTLGGQPMRYPDGTIATGYLADPFNPLNHRVYDAGCSKNILGQFAIKEDFEAVSNQVQNFGPHNGLIQVNGFWTGFIGVGKDTACPWWTQLDYAMTRLAVENGLDAMWSDNFSSWNNLGYPPLQEGFGEWSVARFRDHLQANFTPAVLAGMGVANPAAFDVRAYLRARVLALGGNDTNLDDPMWYAAAWADDPVWRAFLIHKRRMGTEALENYYLTVKQAARDAGNDQFMVAGNDIPGYSLGFPRDCLDMVSTEYDVGPNTNTGWTGFLLPPAGRQSAYYKLAREHAQSRFVNVWLQFNGDAFEPYLEHPHLAAVMFYEMLAAHTTPMALPGFQKAAGPMQTYTDFFTFVKSVKGLFGERRPVEDVGIYYSSSSVLAHLAPGGFIDTINQQHQLGAYGWGMVFDRLHIQYRMIPEWKLNAEALAGLRVLIIPHAEVFDPADVAIVEPWVYAGGLLLVTGNSGQRRGESGNFAANSPGFSLAPLTGVSSMTPAPAQSMADYGAGRVLYVPENRAMQFMNDPARPDSTLASFTAALDALFADRYHPPVTSTGPTTVGTTLYRDSARRVQFLDVNNVDIDIDSDTVTPAGPLTITVEVPSWLDSPDLVVRAVSPDGDVPVELISLVNSRATVNVGSITHYASVVFELTDTDTDGLSDSEETPLGTSPTNWDTDGDGISDYDEIWYDGDGAYNPYHPTGNPSGTDLDALNPDTDGDGVADGHERTFGSDPLNPADAVHLALQRWLWIVLLPTIVATRLLAVRSTAFRRSRS